MGWWRNQTLPSWSLLFSRAEQRRTANHRLPSLMVRSPQKGHLLRLNKPSSYSEPHWVVVGASQLAVSSPLKQQERKYSTLPSGREGGIGSPFGPNYSSFPIHRPPPCCFYPFAPPPDSLLERRLSLPLPSTALWGRLPVPCPFGLPCPYRRESGQSLATPHFHPLRAALGPSAGAL